MKYVTIYDFLLFPGYLAVFYFFVRSYAKKNTATPLKGFLYRAFFLRMFGCFAYTMVMQYYYGYGDTFTFYNGGKIFTEQILKDFSNIRYLFAPIKEISEWYDSNYDNFVYGSYFAQPTGNTIMKISCVLSFISFNKILIISLFFALFSFAGQWKLFLVCNEVNKSRYTKVLAFATLYSPSIWFWGSGLLKDSICMGALGFSVSLLYKIFVKREFTLFRLLILLFMLALLVQIKVYAFAILMLAVSVFIIKKIMLKIKGAFSRIIFSFFALVLIFGVVVSIDINKQVADLVEESIASRNVLKKDYERSIEEEGSKGSFTASDLNPTLSSIMISSPATIFSCLYRPFLWESRSIMILFTSLESTALLFCTLYLLYKTKFWGFFKQIFKNPYLIFCFWFFVVFAIIIGFTTFNFGTMIRYKLIFLPFFYFIHVYIYSELKVKNELINPQKVNKPTSLYKI